MDDAERLRDRQDEADDEASRIIGGDDAGAPCILGKTSNAGAYPTEGGVFYAITPHDVTGIEAEGEDGTLTSTGGQFYALMLGSAVPDEGKTVLCVYVAHRWVFET